LLETPVPSGEAPLLHRQLDAVREGLAQVSSEVTPFFALPGDQLSVRVLGEFPAGSHASIIYPAAIVAGHDSAAARRLLERLRAPAQQAIFREHGFDAPPR
jgi:molybdate transport system substrate-binding protein